MSGLQDYAHAVQQAPGGEFWFAAVICALLAAAAFWGAFVYLKRKRTIEDTPTSLIRSAPQGYIELQGMADLMDGDPIHAPLSMRVCTWYSYKVEHRERHYADGKQNARWSTVDQGTSDDLFYLIDTSGRCAIDPDGAAVTPAHHNKWYGSTRVPGRYHASDGTWWARAIGRMGQHYRYTERRIEPGDQVYALGHFTTHGGAAARFDKDGAVGERLREWKRDQTAMLKRFDTNGDGQIDAEEWDKARLDAEKEVLAEQKNCGSAPPVDVLGHTGDKRRPFVIAAGTEDDIVSRCKRRAAGLLLLAVPLLCASIWAISIRLMAA
jgi:hypothetical protein